MNISKLNIKINIYCIASALGSVLRNMTVEQAKMVLSVSNKPTEEEIKNSYRKLIKLIDPERNTDTFKMLTKARNLLLQHLKSKPELITERII